MAQSSGSVTVDDTRNGWHHDQRRAMIQTECNGECFMFYVSHTGVRALRVLSVYR